MVKLRLRRKGRIHLPVYDIVVVDVRVKRDGKYIERLGYYNPNDKPSTIKIDSERAIYWLNNGAQPTATVKNLLSYEGVLLKRALEFKGKSADEIEEELAKHKDIVKARYERRTKHRADKKAKSEENSNEDSANQSSEEVTAEATEEKAAVEETQE